jgi:glycosyltransferase involved in cell wall biosynthesis
VTDPVRSAFVIPAYNAASRLGPVLEELKVACEAAGLSALPIIVVDDGSSDATAAIADAAGAHVIYHSRNRGKGAALVSALEWAKSQSIQQIVTLDADAQHPPHEAVRLMLLKTSSEVLVLGVRDLVAAGAPRPNQFSNRFSNVVLSLFGGEKLEDTQCGLRRYPVAQTLELRSPDTGYAFESDVVLRAARLGMPMHFVPTQVIYPPEAERLTYFDSVRDPARIIKRVLWTTFTVPHHRIGRRWVPRLIACGAFAWTFLFVASKCAPR